MWNADGGVGGEACATSFKLLLRFTGYRKRGRGNAAAGFCLRSFRVSSETNGDGARLSRKYLYSLRRGLIIYLLYHNGIGSGGNAKKRVSPPRIRVRLMRKVALSEHIETYIRLGDRTFVRSVTDAHVHGTRASLCVNHWGRKEKNHKDKNPAPENKAPRIFRRGMHGVLRFGTILVYATGAPRRRKGDGNAIPRKRRQRQRLEREHRGDLNVPALFAARPGEAVGYAAVRKHCSAR